jgi:nucleoid DNA-binding protein
VTKSELVDQVADRAQLTKQDAARAVDAVIATVEDALRSSTSASAARAWA